MTQTTPSKGQRMHGAVDAQTPPKAHPDPAPQTGVSMPPSDFPPAPDEQAPYGGNGIVLVGTRRLHALP